jgi:hypothetical protein
MRRSSTAIPEVQQGDAGATPEGSRREVRKCARPLHGTSSRSRGPAWCGPHDRHHPAGKSDVGTFVTRSNANGSPSPVLTPVHAGQTYPGAATVADRPYFAACSRLSSPTGALIGMLYVGVPLDAMPS